MAKIGLAAEGGMRTGANMHGGGGRGCGDGVDGGGGREAVEAAGRRKRSKVGWLSFFILSAC